MTFYELDNLREKFGDVTVLEATKASYSKNFFCEDICDNDCKECLYRNDCSYSTVADVPVRYCNIELPVIEDGELPF